MTSSQIALVADDPRLASSVQNLLGKALGRSIFQTNYALIRGHLVSDQDCLLVLLVGSTPDAEQATRLVQEIYLQRLPQVVLLLETTEAGKLSHLDPYIRSRRNWPIEADAILHEVRERVMPGRKTASHSPDTVEDVIARRLLGQTPSLLPLVERIALAAVHEVTVMLTGETGTGKTFLARLLHDCSPRKSAPFVHVPCGAQPASLIESAFFGHVRGAFTGADRTKIGKFEAAGNGTILLDEIDTLGLEQQAGLLRVIETGEYEPVGSNETKRCLARIIVASNWDLEKAVRQGRFRQDLYYRLNVMSFHLPALRERVQDIGPLSRSLVARFATRFRKDLFDINPAVLDVLESHLWPGNIRQLENVLQQAVLLSHGPELQVEHFPVGMRVGTTTMVEPRGEKRSALVQSRESTERAAIQRALANHNNSRSRTASALGISRVTLYKKMKKYGLMEGSPRSEKISEPS